MRHSGSISDERWGWLQLPGSSRGGEERTESAFILTQSQWHLMIDGFWGERRRERKDDCKGLGLSDRGWSFSQQREED